MFNTKSIKLNFIQLIFWFVFLFYFSFALLFSAMLLFLGAGDSIVNIINEKRLGADVFTANLIGFGFAFWFLIFPVIISVFFTMRMGLGKVLFNLQQEVYKIKKRDYDTEKEIRRRLFEKAKKGEYAIYNPKRFKLVPIKKE